MAARADELRQSIDEAMQGLQEVRTDPAGGTADEEQPELHGEGIAFDGLVRVVTGGDGRLESVTIDRQALGADPQVLAGEVMAAANTAIDDLREQYAQAAQETAPDTEALVGQLQAVQHTAVARLETFLKTLTESHLRITSQRG